MKKKCSKMSDEEGSLCCCEYINHHGEKAHILASCCDCEDLDEACDRCLKGKSISSQSIERVSATISDRLRIPWLLGTGAKKIDITILPPLVFLPIFLHIAALHFFLAFTILTSLPILVIWYYYVTHQKKGRTLFFLSLGLFSLGYMYYLFLTEIMPRGTISSVQVILLTTSLVLTLVSVAQTKKDPGYLRTDNRNTPIKDAQKNSISSCTTNGKCEIQPVGWDASTTLNHSTLNGKIQMDQNEFQKDWCKVCKILRPPRSGHCRICANCVQRLDHHCIWINNCVGQGNHRAFILTLFLFLLTSLYGISLTLSTICRGQSIFMALFYCPGVYKEHSTALSFTCAWYCAIVTAGMGYLFLIQLINISYNITERETRFALRDKTGDKYLCGLIIKTDEYNRGLLNNWKEFLRLQPHPRKPGIEDLV
ncbi:palmitoyltransferase ZDHHC23 isoform X2 [Amblyraja radiata]|nr:palmitoyltransferase ZDHHC23 isoform X2 [Amblyraja radiata]XP_032889186.1 palmitoyltransferase ZDHHC23 isoform X2 [Amblyraja radiata]XP_032889187.1 palmitoyltransferase ZDHHC23 isoform X2 [Amblyraja radiata]XP_032889188.1 palmitoyltransferase ZDHHC23 isoform X2 [Amblyraja radiata]XP_032889189.1 palmitoyltransferase ZDHHC23 isoform X2 [Amblyraja radiata]